MHLSLIDIFVIVLYAVLLAVVAHFLAPDSDGKGQDNIDQALKKRTLPWWAIGTSLIAANISAEQIIGMSGSAYAFGLAVAAYEWMAALALLIAGKFFLPIFLKNGIHTMPEFLRRRYGRNIQLTMAVLWLCLYIFVNLTAVLWLGATAVHTVTGLTLTASLILLGLFAGNFALYVGLRPASATDVVQVTMLVLGGLVIVYIALEKVSGGSGVGGFFDGLNILAKRLPDHFHMILKPDNPFYKYAPGLAMVAGGMWIINLSYWGFNQYIIQRALTAESIHEAQKGVVLAALLKLLIPVLVVLPGIAAVLLVDGLGRPDEAYPMLMTMLPNGLLGFVFIALVATIISSMGSALSSIAAIFSRDVLKVINPDAGDRLLSITGRFTAIGALVIAMAAAIPLLGSFDQAFQYIQEFTGFITPGVLTIFLLGLFWKRATEAGALAAVAGSVLVSLALKLFLPAIPFVNRMGYVFLACIGLAVVVSLARKSKTQSSTIDIAGIDYSTDPVFNIASLAVVAVLTAIYAIWW
jgi:solute:Na+ symporter, SSS family